MQNDGYVTKANLRKGRRSVDDAQVQDLFEAPEQPEDLLFDVSAEAQPDSRHAEPQGQS